MPSPKILLVHSDGRDDKSLQSALNRTQCNVHSELGTILAQSQQFEASSHRPRATIIRETQSMTDMRQSISIGDEVLDPLAVELARGILEHYAGLLAGEKDGPRLINDERGVFCVREDPSQRRGGLH